MRPPWISVKLDFVTQFQMFFFGNFLDFPPKVFDGLLDNLMHIAWEVKEPKAIVLCEHNCIRIGLNWNVIS